MAELSCKAQNCTYNASNCCCKGDIMVGGRSACECEGTCCESFAERRGDSTSNVVGEPKKMSSIDCEVVNCTYNTNYKCYADHVDIHGSSASTSRETACGTFQEK